MGLAAESEALDDLLVFFFGACLDVVEEFPALRDQLEQAAAGREILLVNVEVVREVEDALGHQGHLIGCATGVTFVKLVVFQVDCVVAHIGRGWDQRSPGRPRLGVGAESSVRGGGMQGKSGIGRGSGPI